MHDNFQFMWRGVQQSHTITHYNTVVILRMEVYILQTDEILKLYFGSISHFPPCCGNPGIRKFLEILVKNSAAKKARKNAVST